MSSPHRDCAVQTSRLTVVADDAESVQPDAVARCYSARSIDGVSLSQVETCDQDLLSNSSTAARRHFAKYEPHQLQEMSDEIELGWDCGICLETAEDPCVTRCGHLYCQSHLNHWLSTHPSCPVCKTLCTPARDVVPIFSRGRTSPVPSSSIPSSPTSPTPSDRPCHDLRAAPPLTPHSRSGSPRPPGADLGSQWPDWTANDHVMSDYDIMDNEQVPRPSPRVPGGASYSPLQPHPHPLMTSYILAHYLGIALRIVGVGILLGVLLR